MGETVSLTDRYVRIGGLKVHLHEGGRGTSLLLIHGLGGPLMWQRVLVPLSKRFRVMAVDLPGFGDSDPLAWNPAAPDPVSGNPFVSRPAGPSRDMEGPARGMAGPGRGVTGPGRDPVFGDPGGRDASFKGYGEFLFEVLEQLRLRNAVVCGISWGGQLALQLADRHPECVEKLILICPSGLHCHSLARNPAIRMILPALLKPVLRSPFLIDYFSRRSFYNIQNRPPDLCQQFRESLRREGR